MRTPPNGFLDGGGARTLEKNRKGRRTPFPLTWDFITTNWAVETCGQIACSVKRLPIRFTVGTGGTIIEFHGGHRRHDQDESTGDTVSFL